MSGGHSNEGTAGGWVALQSRVDRVEKSAEVIVPERKRAGIAKPIPRRSHKKGRTERRVVPNFKWNEKKKIIAFKKWNR